MDLKSVSELSAKEYTIIMDGSNIFETRVALCPNLKISHYVQKCDFAVNKIMNTVSYLLFELSIAGKHRSKLHDWHVGG